MSPVAQLSILALASAALAVPYHGHQHERFHSPQAYGSSVGTAHFTWNGTRPSGSGYSTGASASTSLSKIGGYGAQTTIPVYAAGSSSSVAVAAASGSGDCSDDVTVTSTAKTTVYVTASSSLANDVSAVVEETTTSAGKVLTLKSTIFSTVHSTVYVSALPSSGYAASSVSAYSPSSYASSAPVYSPPGYASSAVSSMVSSAAVSPVTQSSSSSSVSSSSSSSSSFSSSSSTSTSSSYAAPTTSSSSSSAAAYTPPAYTPPASSSSSVAPTTSSSSSVPAWTPPAYSSASSSAAGVANAIKPSSASSAAAATSSAASAGTGKRGLAYNDASLTSMFAGSKSVSWAYNWGSSTTDLASGINYIPLLWGLKSDFTSSWISNAKSAIASGSTHVFSFNEPDLSSQANMAPAAAATAWKTFIEPLAGQAKLCAPAVTNGGGAMGLTWLSNFLEACSGCTIDCVNIHWYDSAQNPDYFKSHVTNATEISGGKPVWVSEFGASGSDDQVSSFLEEVMPWMDGNDAVAGYAYFMVGQGLLVNGDSPSKYGETYMSYTG